MDAKKILSVLGAMSVVSAAIPVVASSTDKADNQTIDGVVLYSGAHGDASTVGWHSSHGSHTSHSSHSSSRW